MGGFGKAVALGRVEWLDFSRGCSELVIFEINGTLYLLLELGNC